MAKRFPLDIIISATDKASSVLNRVSDKIDKFYSPFNRLHKAFGEFADKTGLAGVGSALANVGAQAFAVGRKIATSLAIGTAALAAFTWHTAMAADTIGDTSARLNIGTTAFQAYSYGFQQADVDAESFTVSLDTLNKNLGLAKLGLGKAVPLFRGLGLDPRRFKTIDELLPALAAKLSRIHDPTRRAAIATRLLGDAGAQMALKLGEGPKALRDMEAAARAAGAIIDPRVIESAGLLDARFKSLKATFAGVAGNALGKLYPAFIKIAEAIQASIIRHMPQIEAFAAQFAGRLPVYISRTADVFSSLATIAEKVSKAIGWCNDHFGTTATVLGVLMSTIGIGLTSAIAQLGTALVRLGISFAVAFPIPTLIVAAVAAAAAAGWWLYKNWDKVSMAIGDSIDWVIDKFSTAWENIKAVHVAAFEWIADKIKILYKATGLEWLFDRVSSFGGMNQPAASGSLVGPVLGSALTPTQSVQVSVDLSNLPPGTRATATASPGLGFELNRGYAMSGAF